MGRIDNNSWVVVSIYNANNRGHQFNRDFSNWTNNHLSMGDHRCLNGAEFKIYNRKVFIANYTLFGVNIGIQGNEIPSLFDEKCIFCIDLEQVKLNEEESFTNDEEEIINFYGCLKNTPHRHRLVFLKTLKPKCE